MITHGYPDRDCLVAEHSYLVVSEVARYRTWRLDRTDLHQAGLLGLLVAAARFDPDRAVPFAGYAHSWVRKEIQRAIARQEFPTVVPAELIGRTVALRRALDENADRLALAAAALGLSPATVQALHRQLDVPTAVDEDELPAPGIRWLIRNTLRWLPTSRRLPVPRWPAYRHSKPTHWCCGTGSTAATSGPTARSVGSCRSPGTRPRPWSSGPRHSYADCLGELR